MYNLAKALKNLKFDNRMLDWNIKQKVLAPEEHKKYLGTLEDISHLKQEEKARPSPESSASDTPDSAEEE